MEDGGGKAKSKKNQSLVSMPENKLND